MKYLTMDKNIVLSNPLEGELPFSKGPCLLLNSSCSVYQVDCFFVLLAGDCWQSF